MQAKEKMILRRTVDAALTLLLLLLMAYQVTGQKLHEWLGIGMTATLILHHILNIRWYASLFRGKYNLYRAVTAAVNTLLLLAILLTAVCGMAMSMHAVPFLYRLLPVAFARQFHLAMSYWSFLLMGVHLGLHLPAMTAGIRWRAGAMTVLRIAFGLIAGWGFFLFLKNGIPDYIFFRTPFAFLDFQKPGILVFLEYLLMLLSFAFLGSTLARLFSLLRDKSGERKGKLIALGAAFAAAVFATALLLLL